MKKISPSQIVKFLFTDAYKDIPEWILEKAAEFGKDLHESIQAYIDKPDFDDEIKEALIAENKIRLYEAFKQWFKEQEIQNPRTEYYLETEALHGYLDLVSFEGKKFWDYKFRNVDKKLDLTKDVLQMMVYQYILTKTHNEVFKWELVIFDKKTAKIYLLKSSYLDQDYKNYLTEIIEQVILILINKQGIETINKDDLESWDLEQAAIERAGKNGE